MFKGWRFAAALLAAVLTLGGVVGLEAQTSSFPAAEDSLCDPTRPTPTPSAQTNGTCPHAELHESENSAIEALENKLGTGASTPFAGSVLYGTSDGTSAYQIATPAPTDTPAPTATPISPVATDTPAPTATPRATDTPIPAATPEALGFDFTTATPVTGCLLEGTGSPTNQIDCVAPGTAITPIPTPTPRATDTPIPAPTAGSCGTGYPCGTGLTTASNTLGSDVPLNNTANYFVGPSVAQDSSGTWCAAGTVTLIDSAGGANFLAKLWDGTTVISSGYQYQTTTNANASIALSGCIASPTGNIRISARDSTSTSGAIAANNTGSGKDSTLTVWKAVG